MVSIFYNYKNSYPHYWLRLSSPVHCMELVYFIFFQKRFQYSCICIRSGCNFKKQTCGLIWFCYLTVLIFFLFKKLKNLFVICNSKQNLDSQIAPILLCKASNTLGMIWGSRRYNVIRSEIMILQTLGQIFLKTTK